MHAGYGLPDIARHVVETRLNSQRFNSILCDAAGDTCLALLPGLRTFYLSAVSLFGSGTLMVTCMDRFQASRYTPMRAFLFSCLGGCGVFPIFHQAGWLF